MAIHETIDPVETVDAGTIRPHGSIARQGIVTLLALITPLFGVLYFLTIPDGTWHPVLVGHAIVMAVGAAAMVAYFSVRITVTPSGITKRNILGYTRTINRSCVGGMLMAHVYQGYTMQTEPHLFIIDKSRRAAMRMRGPLWTRDSTDRVACALDLHAATVAEPMTTRQLRLSHPHLLHWVERRPVVLATLTGVGIALTGVVATSLFALAGLPLTIVG